MTAVFAANARPIVRVSTSLTCAGERGKPASICPYPTKLDRNVSRVIHRTAGLRRIAR